MALDAHPSSYSGSAWKAVSRNRTVVLRSRPSYCYHAVPTLPGQVGNPASIERDRPGLDCGGAELTTFLLGTAGINLLSPWRGSRHGQDRRPSGRRVDACLRATCLLRPRLPISRSIATTCRLLRPPSLPTAGV